MNIEIPELSLVVLIGVSGSGKSTFAARHFKPTEVVSSDACRAMVSDDENAMHASKAAFEVLHTIVRKRLEHGRLAVVDATNVQREARKQLVTIARESHVLPVAIVFDLPRRVCEERNRQRTDRQLGSHVVRRQYGELRRSARKLDREGFRHVFRFDSEQDVDGVVLKRAKLWVDRREEHGPFDIIGDVHGCFDELAQLIERLGYALENTEGGGYAVSHPSGRKLVFVGDLVDRGPKITDVLRLVMATVEGGQALCVCGNHEQKLARALGGRQVQVTHGLAQSLEAIEAAGPEFRTRARSFLDGLISHYVLDGGSLVVAHAGLKEAMQGRASRAVREFALYGETTGESDEFGLPVRLNWAADYRGKARVVYGHTPVAEPEWLNDTINIDTGCVFGGSLTALRYPEMELVQVPAAKQYYAPSKPFLPEGEGAPPAEARDAPDTLDLEDVLGRRAVSTRLHHNVTIREENATAALEVISRFAADPRWLIYLPPTMGPVSTSAHEDLLEHPEEAFAYYRSYGVSRVVCEEKHMGSRAVVIVCRDADSAGKRFHIKDGSAGAILTRTGRRFFDGDADEAAVLARVRQAAGKAGAWEELGTDFLVLDTELMPWSAKAEGLLREQYAPVGASARMALTAAASALAKAESVSEVKLLVERYRDRAAMADAYTEAYRRYCWPVEGTVGIKIAPFHLLASAKGVHIDKDHLWHLDWAKRLAEADPDILMVTDHRLVDVTDADSQAEATAWWEQMTAKGGEGMVVKPLEFVAKGPRGLVQPALKVRGREYLRIIYGPEYTAPEQMAELRNRSVRRKHGLALREFALGVEGLERFQRGEPLYRVHECAFGVLALESEPVDPRL